MRALAFYLAICLLVTQATTVYIHPIAMSSRLHDFSRHLREIFANTSVMQVGLNDSQNSSATTAYEFWNIPRPGVKHLVLRRTDNWRHATNNSTMASKIVNKIEPPLAPIKRPTAHFDYFSNFGL